MSHVFGTVTIDHIVDMRRSNAARRFLDVEYQPHRLLTKFVCINIDYIYMYILYHHHHHHHHLAASAEIELTTPFQYSLLVIAVRRSSLDITVSLLIMSGKVSFRDHLCDDGCLQRTKDEISLSEARA